MNAFDTMLKDTGNYPLKAEDISTIQVNIGYKCNLACTHCHINASPNRTEQMSSEDVDRIIDILRGNEEIAAVDITGGSPEYNPHLKRLIKASFDMGKEIILRSNLAIYTEEEFEGIPAFLAENKVKIVASLPCYSEDGVDIQRGKGTYKKAIKLFKHLNKLGYAQRDTGLEIDIMYNPDGAKMALSQQSLEKAYRVELNEMHGISFNNLLTLSNMPIGRLGRSTSDDRKREYIKELEGIFNELTVKNLMCRHLISVSPDGRLYDCDFWQAINLPVKSDCSTVDRFDYLKLSNREIATTSLCFMCTAGEGASCSGALV